MTLKNMICDIETKITISKSFLFEKRYNIWIHKIMYYKYKQIFLYFYTFSKSGVTSNIG